MEKRRKLSKRVALLSALIFSTGAASFAWGATLATDWGNLADEGVNLSEVDAYDGEEAAFEEPILAEETPTEADAEAPAAEAKEAEEAREAEETAEAANANDGYSLRVHGAETRETHVKHVEEASAFRVLLDKLELGATITAVGQQSDFDATDSGIDGSLMVEVEAFAELTERDSMRATFKVGMGDGLGARVPSFCGFNAATGATRDIYLNQLC